MSESYKGLTINNAGDPPPNGAIEEAAIKAIIDTLVIGTAQSQIDATNGHRHTALYTDSGTVVSIDADDLSGVLVSLQDNAGAKKLYIKDSGSVEVFSADSDGNIIAAGDIKTVAMTDYSATSTIVGWSSYDTKKIFYKKVGKLVFCQFSLRGTSDADTASFTLPYAPSFSTFWVGGCLSSFDNSSDYNVGDCYYGDGKFNLLKTPLGASASWTAANIKDIRGQFWFEV
jgi:hypothetical protein